MSDETKTLTQEEFEEALRSKSGTWPCTKCDCKDYNPGTTGGSCETKGCGHKGTDHEVS